MVAGHLRVQNGYWQMILSYKDSTGKRRTKSVTTHLKEKGNKRRAEAMLLDLRRAFTKERQHDLQHGPMFSDFMRDWLAQIRPTVAPTTFASYCRVVEQSIVPYFEEKPEFKNEDMQTLSPYMISGKLEGKELELTLELV